MKWITVSMLVLYVNDVSGANLLAVFGVPVFF